MTVAAAMVGVSGLAVVLAALRFATPLVANAFELVTLGWLALAPLGLAYRRGSRRAFWLGFVLLGWGYRTLSADQLCSHSEPKSLATSMLLDALQPGVQDGRARESAPQLLRRLAGFADPANTRVLAALERPVPVTFDDPTPLRDVLRSIRDATRGESLPEGIPFHIDSAGWTGDPGTWPLSADLRGVPLRTALGMMLDEAGMAYLVRDGVVVVSGRTLPDEEDGTSFGVIGHCVFALLFGGLGGVVGRYAYASRDCEGPNLAGI